MLGVVEQKKGNALSQLPPAWPFLNTWSPWQQSENGEKQKAHLAQN